jgi:hypothetical protein
MKDSPNKLRIHEDGRMSVRINGRWADDLVELSQEQYLALPREDRKRLIQAEYASGRSLTSSPVIVSAK